MATAAQGISKSPFGQYRPPWWARALVSICQMLPGNGLGKKLAFLIRKPVLVWVTSPMDVYVNGLRCRLYPGQNLSDKRLLTTPHLLDGVERDYLQKRLPPHAVVVDVGANVGGYTLLLLQQRPDLRVLAIEPDPALVSRMSDNLKLNEFDDRCEISNVAITDKPGMVRLIQYPGNEGKNSLATELNPSSPVNSIAVDGHPLLDVLDRNGIERFDLLKIDIEGHEHSALQAFLTTALPERRPTYIQIEQYRTEGINNAVSLCLAHGYRIMFRTRMNVVLKHLSAEFQETQPTPVAVKKVA